MRVLVTGFEVFGGLESNPTSDLIKALQNHEILYPSTLEVDQILLPVSFSKVFPLFQNKVNSFNPDVIISFGLANSREAIELETIAVNEINADIADNQGSKPVHQKISQNGANHFLSTLPLTGIEAALKLAGIPVNSSQTAGTFVCNYLFYKMMETNQDTYRLCGFIHVPPEKALPLEELKRGLSVILNYLEY